MVKSYLLFYLNHVLIAVKCTFRIYIFKLFLGHRRCPGEIVAKCAIFLLFAGIMKSYKLLPVSSNNLPEMDPQPGLTISPKPYEVLLIER